MRMSKERGSYLPVLIRLVQQTNGPILELGMGYCSSPYLHWACYPSRPLTSYENNPQYYDFGKTWSDKFHAVHCITDWDAIDIAGRWSVALVDHSPSGRRADELRRLVDCDYVIVHDTENKNDRKYHVSRIQHLYRNRWKYTAAYPFTTVFSNHHELTPLAKLFGPGG